MEEMENQEQTKKKDLQQTQKLFARTVGKRVLVERDREDSQRRSRRRAWRREREEEDGAARDESEMQKGRGGTPSVPRATTRPLWAL